MSERHFESFVDNYARLALLKAPERVDIVPTPERNPAKGPVVAIVSPHPDDECITGLLALRLRRDYGARIVNLAVTLGSDPSRREERLLELERACEVLDIENKVLGLHGCRAATKSENPDLWANWTHSIVTAFLTLKPALVIHPHLEDAHPTHVGVGLLIRDALRQIRDAPIPLPWRAESEYWHPHHRPTWLVGATTADVALLVEALSLHVGENQRNNYATRLPAWMIDNVRRGAERVGKHGDPAPDFAFGVLYHLVDSDGNHIDSSIIGPEDKIPLALSKRRFIYDPPPPPVTETDSEEPTAPAASGPVQ